MSALPHDIPDLLLAPVLLELDAQIGMLGLLDPDALRERVARESDLADWTRELREAALLRTISYLVECHGWVLSWDTRGIRVAHGDHHVVLGAPATFVQFVSGGPAASTSGEPDAPQVSG